MVRRLVYVGFALALCVPSLPAQKDTGTKDTKEIVGKVKAVDAVKGTVTVTVDGKDRVFVVTKDTKIVGPKGGVSTERLKDDRLTKGAEVRIIVSADGKTAKQVKLPVRRRATGKDK